MADLDLTAGPHATPDDVEFVEWFARSGAAADTTPTRLPRMTDLAEDDVCEWCGGEATTGVCPKSLPCPVCPAQPGQSCKRPSGHRAASMHAARVDAAEQQDAEALIGQQTLATWIADGPQRPV